MFLVDLDFCGIYALLIFIWRRRGFIRVKRCGLDWRILAKEFPAKSLDNTGHLASEAPVMPCNAL
jgi:hypothetical protein